MVRVQDASWQFTRRQVLKTGAGLASLVALGILPRSVLAQASSGPAQLFNPGETPPTAASGELNHALQFDPVNLDSIATYTVANARWEGAVYSPLTWRDPNLVLYDGLDGRPGPDQGFGLAAGFGQPSADGQDSR